MILSYRACQADLLEIGEKINGIKTEMHQIQNKINENDKLVQERRKLIGNLEASSRMFQLQITEIQSTEYPQEADVEVMVNYSLILFLLN